MKDWTRKYRLARSIGCPRRMSVMIAFGLGRPALEADQVATLQDQLRDDAMRLRVDGEWGAERADPFEVAKRLDAAIAEIDRLRGAAARRAA